MEAIGAGADEVTVEQALRVLIVEDDRTSRIVLKRVLQGLGNIEVAEAEDGLKALEILDGGLRPGLSFLDINMPRMNGVDLLKRIRGDSRMAGLKVCFCSAVRDRKIILRAAVFQPDYYVLKPYSRHTIQAQVRKAREGTSRTRTLEPVGLICARLGIDEASYGAMLCGLVDDSKRLLSRIPLQVTQMDLEGATLALDRTRSAAKTLGALRLFDLTDSMARQMKLMGTQGLFNLADSMANLAKSTGQGFVPGSDPHRSNERVRRFHDLSYSTDQIFQIMRDMRSELEIIERLAMHSAQVRPDGETRLESTKSRLPSDLDGMARFVTDIFHRS
jgi:two-component system chemotaxis response regulator CheY